MTITYGSICSGIEAATVAWHPLGWRAEWFAEIEPFPSAVLAYRWPEVSNLGDMTKLARQVLAGSIAAPEVLVGGTPCQAFSVAGMRAGLDDPRGQLTIKYVELADAVDHVRPAGDECVIVWENVPGVLSDKGNAFGCFLGALVGESDALQPSGGKWTDAGCVYGPRRSAAWRVLDVQYFGLAQRRRRVFVVASARAGFDPAAVLFEREGVRRDHPPRRGEGENPTGTIAGGARRNGGYSTDDIPLTAGSLRAQAQSSHREDSETFIPVAFGGGANCQQTDVATALSAHPGGTRMDAETETFIVAGTLQANGKAAGSATQQDAESGLLVVHGTQDPCVDEHIAHALGRNHGQENAILAFAENSRAEVRLENGDGQIVGALSTGGGKAGQGTPCIAFSCKDYGNDATSELSPTLRAMGHGESHANAGGQVAVCVTGDITHTLKADGFDGSEDGTGRGQPIVAFQSSQSGVRIGETHATLDANNGPRRHNGVVDGSAVRRLTPRECERLQGFPDDYTLIPWRGKPAEDCPDGPRYKAIGNSKAVPVVRWIGRRIQRELERAR
ncbi:DNA cytosine methyltransferase [Pseudomonas sp. LMG 31766]|uniref:DNA (cytosine-5-)-methyltransferase n=1 Tax=Pseudomonas chaetocerotis TaxID=2758695 RepID=A0A931CXZ4_9PSED|nr:DNA cytosine methyltransferase [Pseudomonas chaetocerotis]MBZ9665781.1 DNA cytosine methyltransferase [Pseudomonas chaetocerotis]